MKSFILVLLFSSTALFASAQKWEVGLNAGGSYNGPVDKISNESYSLRPYSKITSAADVKLAYNTKKWQYGMSVGYNKLAFRYRFHGIICWYGMPTEEEEYNAYNPTAIVGYMPIDVFVNKKFEFKSIRAYGGLSAGYMGNIGNPAESRKTHGFSGGIQAGADYGLSKQWALNTELSGKYLLIKGLPYELGGAFAAGATVGVKYRF